MINNMKTKSENGVPVADVHVHFFPDESVFDARFISEVKRARGGVDISLVTEMAEYWRQAAGCQKAIVFGGKAKRSGIWVPDEAVAALVSGNREQYAGFMSLDLATEGWEREMRVGVEELGLVGVKLMPMYGGFRPDAEQFRPFWQYVQNQKLPVLLHTGTTFIADAPLDCTLPRHLDRVAMEFPEVRMILAHLGHPYEGECVAVIRKHQHVYADISALHYRPWQLFHSLMLVHEYGVWNKLFFGTDYPFTTVEESVRGLKRIWEIEIAGFRLPAEELTKLFARDPWTLLQLIIDS